MSLPAVMHNEISRRSWLAIAVTTLVGCGGGGGAGALVLDSGS